jgi:hypothetical protein
MKLDYQTLKARQRKLRDTLPINVNLEKQSQPGAGTGRNPHT